MSKYHILLKSFLLSLLYIYIHLYHLELTNLVKTKLASNIDHFDMRDGMITAYYKHPHDVYEENQYVTYKEFS